MAINRIQNAAGQNGGGGTAVSVTLTNPSTSGTLLVVGAYLVDRDSSTPVSVSSVTDDQGNTYVIATGSQGFSVGSGGDGYLDSEIWYCANAIGGVSSITVNYTRGILESEAFVAEYSGVDNSNTLEMAANLSNQNSSAVSPNLTSTTSGALFFAMPAPNSISNSIHNYGGVNSPWSVAFSDVSHFHTEICDYIPGSITTSQAVFTPTFSGDNFCSSGAVFKEATMTLLQNAAGQNGGGGTAVSTISRPLPNPTTSGSLLAVGIYLADSSSRFTPSTVTSVTDDQGNTYISVPAALGSSSTGAVGYTGTEIWYCANSIGGVTSIQANYTRAVDDAEIYVAEYSGSTASNPVDTAGNLSNQTGSAIGPSLTNSDPNGVFFSIPGSSFTSGSPHVFDSVNNPWDVVFAFGGSGGFGMAADYLPGAIVTSNAVFTPTNSGGNFCSSGVVFLSTTPDITLTLSDSITVSDELIATPEIILTDSMSVSTETFKLQSSDVLPLPDPALERLTLALLPAYVKAYFKFQ